MRGKQDMSYPQKVTKHILLKKDEHGDEAEKQDLPSGFGVVSITCSNLMFEISYM